MIQTGGVILWNQIPRDIKESESFTIFVERYKTHLFPAINVNQIHTES